MKLLSYRNHRTPLPHYCPLEHLHSHSSRCFPHRNCEARNRLRLVLILLMLQPHLFIKHCHLSLRHQNALTTVTRVLLRWLLKVSCARAVCLFSGYGVISHGRSGYAASPSNITGTLLPPNFSVI